MRLTGSRAQHDQVLHPVHARHELGDRPAQPVTAEPPGGTGAVGR